MKVVNEKADVAPQKEKIPTLLPVKNSASQLTKGGEGGIPEAWDPSPPPFGVDFYG